MGDFQPVRAVTGRLAAVVFASVVMAGVSCGGATAPSPQAALDLAGRWTGTWTFVSAGATVTDSAAVTLVQSGTSVSGQWSSGGGPGGQVSFTAGTTITGNLSLSQTLLSGVNCSATTSLTGTASSTQIQFTLGTLTSSGLCQWASSHQFTLTR